MGKKNTMNVVAKRSARAPALLIFAVLLVILLSAGIGAADDGTGGGVSPVSVLDIGGPSAWDACEAEVEYTVAAGDALGIIADRFDVTASAILYRNPELASGLLEVGQVLIIPAPATPTSKPASDDPDCAAAPVQDLSCQGWRVTVNLGAGEVPTQGRDIILGTFGRDTIDGLRGNDVICGLGGADRIYGGHGDDLIYGGGGHDWISGGEGSDTVYGQPGADTINGDDGDDLLLGGPGFDVVSGGDGDDNIQGAGGRDTLDGGAGNDLIFGKAGDDVMSGGPGDDELYGAGGDDELFSGVVNGLSDSGADRLQGGSGDDVLWGGGDGPVTLFGQAGDDTLYGGYADDFLYGAAGADRLIGVDGNDHLNGGAGPDFLVGGQGDDQLFGQGDDDQLFGGSGDDSCFGGGDENALHSCGAASTLVAPLNIELRSLESFGPSERVAAMPIEILASRVLQIVRAELDGREVNLDGTSCAELLSRYPTAINCEEYPIDTWDTAVELFALDEYEDGVLTAYPFDTYVVGQYWDDDLECVFSTYTAIPAGTEQITANVGSWCL